MDYDAIYKELWQAVQDNEQALANNSRQFLDDFIAQAKADGYEITEDSTKVIDDYLDGIKTIVKDGITTAAEIGAGVTATTTVVSAWQNEAILKASAEAFARRYPDGLNLSERLWRLDNDTRDGLQKVLSDGIAQGRASNAMVYDMQRAIERSGDKFKIINEYNQSDWAGDLYSTAKGVIHDPKARQAWQAKLAEVQAHIDTLSETGSKNAATELFAKIREAVNTGNAQLLDDSLNWWVYDRQLLDLKRIVRTEMANAGHQAVLSTTINDPLIGGYQWSLSGTHADSGCVCSEYADHNEGLGRGIFAKDTVPNSKPHPNCMCRITPVTLSKIRRLQSQGQ